MALLAAGCGTPQPLQLPEGASVQPAGAAMQQGRRYVVDAQASELRLLVYRDGPMARFGHNHVMLGRVAGEVRVGATADASSFRIELPVEALEVDRVELRAEEGEDFSATVSDPARKGTRANMLGPDVLDAAHYPKIIIESLALAGPLWNPDVTARITVRGRASELKFPAAVRITPDEVTVIASFDVVQTRMGMKPYSVLNGAISVRDAIRVRVRLVARASGG